MERGTSDRLATAARTGVGQRGKCVGVHRSPFTVQPFSRSAFSVQRSAFSVQRSAFGVRRSAFSVRRSAFGV